MAAAAAASSCKNSPRDARALRRYLEKCDVYVCPSNLHVALVAPELLPKGIQVAPQNCNFKGCGAYTGEMAVEQIKDMGMGTVLIGHSERRGEFGLPTPKETNALLATKLAYILEAGLTCVFCIGEALPIREKGIEAVIAECGVQLTDIIPILKALEDKSRVVIAYEPVWAIGTGVSATPELAQETHAALRAWISRAVDKETADAIRIQYGGRRVGARARAARALRRMRGAWSDAHVCARVFAGAAPTPRTRPRFRRAPISTASSSAARRSSPRSSTSSPRSPSRAPRAL